MKTIFKILFIVLVILSLLEIGLRIKHDVLNKTTSPSYMNQTAFFSTFGNMENQKRILSAYDQDQHEYIPYLLWRAIPHRKTGVVNINSQGFRGEEWPSASKKIFRVILLGASAAWGYGASSDKATISSYMEDELNSLFKKKNINIPVEVLNAATNGYNSTQEFIFWKDMNYYQPDLVIHYNGYSDIYIGSFGWKKGSPLQLIPESYITYDRFKVAKEIVTQIINELLEKIYLYRSIKYRLGYYQEEKRGVFNNIDEITETYTNNMRIVSYLAQKMNIPTIVVLQPNLFTKEKNLSMEEKKLLEEYVLKYPSLNQYVSQAQKSFNNQLEILARQQNLNYIDGSSFFNEVKENIYFDTVHNSDNGYKIIADKIVQRITEPKIWEEINTKILAKY